MAQWRGRKGKLGKIKLNPDTVANLRNEIREAVGDVMAELDLEYEKVIEDMNAFADQGFIDWDIVDTGRFRDSQKVNIATVDSQVVARWVWNPESPENGYHYAAALYYGFYAFGNQNAWIPGRRWVELGIKRVNPVRKLAANLRERGVSAKVARNNVNALDLQ